jgi:hypothetical protein
LLEVQLYDLEGGLLKLRGTELVPLVTLKSLSGFVVRDNDTLFVIDLEAKPRSGERGLVEIDGYHVIRRVYHEGEKIRVGSDSIASDAVRILGRVSFAEEKPIF